MHIFNAFSRNVNNINRKDFPTHDKIYKPEKIQQAFWREIKPKVNQRKMKGCIPEANLQLQGW